MSYCCIPMIELRVVLTKPNIKRDFSMILNAPYRNAIIIPVACATILMSGIAYAQKGADENSDNELAEVDKIFKKILNASKIQKDIATKFFMYAPKYRAKWFADAILRDCKLEGLKKVSREYEALALKYRRQNILLDIEEDSELTNNNIKISYRQGYLEGLVAGYKGGLYEGANSYALTENKKDLSHLCNLATQLINRFIDKHDKEHEKWKNISTNSREKVLRV